MSDFIHTAKYFDCMYVVNNPQGRVLRLGDIVIVHPTEKSTMREPYPGIICKQFFNWTADPCYEITMKAMNGFKYAACLNDYLFERLEPVKWIYIRRKNIEVAGFEIQKKLTELV